MLGIGAMIRSMSGSDENASDFYGKIITEAKLDDDKVFLTFEDGTKIRVFDDGQSCCESRYMRTDDDVQTLVGQKIVSMGVKSAENGSDDGYGEHEICFLEIQTENFPITFSNHNEHNGYYGGFGMTVQKIND